MSDDFSATNRRQQEWNMLVQKVIEPALQSTAAEVNAASAFAEVSVSWKAPYADRCAVQIRLSPRVTETAGGQFAVVWDRAADIVRLEERIGTADQPIVRARRTRAKVTADTVKSYARACAARLLKGTEPGRVLIRRAKKTG